MTTLCSPLTKRKETATPDRLEALLNGSLSISSLLSDPSDRWQYANWPMVFKHEKKDASLLLLENFLSLTDCTLLLAHLETLKLEHEPRFKRGIVECRMRRSVGFFAEAGVDGYRYAGQTSRSSPLTPMLALLLKLVNALFDNKSDYNGILINRYADESEYISPHRDNEAELSPYAGVVCISVGATRRMDFHSNQGSAIKSMQSVPITGGSIMCMAGKEFQSTYKHGIARHVAKPADKVRYSLTLRAHNKEF